MPIATTKALTFETFGGADVLQYRDVPMPALSQGNLLVEMTAIGLNFADIYRRKGIYPLDGQPPYISGYEGVGQIVSVGDDQADWKIGDRVGFADVPFAHARHVIVPVDRAIAIPETVSDQAAASLLLQGLTAQYLLQDSVAVREGHTILIHAAAGGVGRLLTQMAVGLGAKVHALASTPEKRNRPRKWRGKNLRL